MFDYFKNNYKKYRLLSLHTDKIEWYYLSKNPSSGAIKLLLATPRKIEWSWLSVNTSSRAIELLAKNQDKIEWRFLSQNPAPEALELLALNPDKINWRWLSANPGLFKVIELIKENEHLGQRQRFAFAKLLLSDTSPDIIRKILEDKPEPTPEARLVNIRR